MLKSQKKAEFVQPAAAHVDLFVENYDRLKHWAMQFSEYDSVAAEDLLHDFFLHLSVSKPDLQAVQNLEGYLYIVMRNLHLSQVRRATRMPQRSLSVIEFDTVDLGFWASDPRDRIRMQDELGAVCSYACIRKESSKAGSVLILRFFHGYYPDEIAKIMCVTRPAVKERLRLARAEAKLYLEDPNRLGFINDHPIETAKFSVDPAHGELRNQIRRTIFSSRHGDHLVEAVLQNFYKTDSSHGPELRELAHIVSCFKCLDEVNLLLGIPTLASRYPEDTVGKDPGRRGGGSGGSFTGRGGRKMLDSYIRRSKDLYYHEPQELCVAVNGHLQGLQRVASEKSEMTLIIDMTENLGFVEVFSEQGVRLLLLNVEPPPEGQAKQTARVSLSDGRTLDADLNFSGSYPALRIIYEDPSLAAEALVSEPGAVATGDFSHENRGAVNHNLDKSAFRIPHSAFDWRGGSLLSSLTGRWKGLAQLKYWLQPARLTTAIAVLLIATLLILKFAPLGTVSAAELLTRSANAEEARLSNKDRVLHRTLDLEEYRNGRLAARQRIDIWHSAERGITARRIYDDQGRLTTGDWRSSNGIQTIYQPGQAAMLQPVPQDNTKAIGFDNAWQLSVSAKEFQAVLGDTAQANVEARDNDYVITYAPEGVLQDERATASGPGATNSAVTGALPFDIVSASITLSRDDLHATEQSFALRQNGEAREFRFVEASYEWRPANSVAPAVFEPNVELTAGTSTSRAERRAAAGVPGEAADSDTNNNAPTFAVATAALEVEVIDALNGAGAFMGEQVSVQRVASGRLQVSALVDNDKRKSDLLAALNKFKTNPALSINIETVAEAEKRQKRDKGRQSMGEVSINRVEATEDTSPVYNDLRKKFSDTEARAFADRILSRSREARRHALAARQLSDRFSISDLTSLTTAERERWLSLIRGHASAYLAAIEAMRRDLQTVFPDLAAGGAGAGVGSNKEIQAAVRELYQAVVDIDEDLRSSFALFTNARSSAEVKTARFWRQLNNAAAIARSLQQAK